MHSFTTPLLRILFCIFALCRASFSAGADAFSLKGNFEDILGGNHFNGGNFSIEACESNALIDVTFENSFRQMVGTDGKDTFMFIPFTGDRTAVRNANGQATINSGRFPIDAHFIEQILWLAVVHDESLFANLNNINFPFYGSYGTNEISVKFEAGDSSDSSLSSVKWFAPDFVTVGTNRYPLPMYPKGWLLAEIATDLRKEGTLNLPRKIKFVQYKTHVVTDPSKLNELRPRNPDDVQPFEVIEFSVTDGGPIKQLITYVPEIIDPSVHVNDKRTTHGWVRVSSGNWWNVGRLRDGYEATSKRHRYLILLILLVALSISTYVLFRFFFVRRNNQNK